MSRMAIQLLTLATCVTALVLVPGVAPIRSKGGLASPIPGLPVRRGLVTGSQSVRQAAPARATAEASSVASGLLQFMMILIEKFQARMVAERTELTMSHSILRRILSQRLRHLTATR